MLDARSALTVEPGDVPGTTRDLEWLVERDRTVLALVLIVNQSSTSRTAPRAVNQAAASTASASDSVSARQSAHFEVY